MTEPARVCSVCGDPVEADPVDEAVAHAEALALWGRRGDAPGMELVCGPCWRRVMAWRDAAAWGRAGDG